jgi:uncharacterized repeat protein (TIGR03833 family)
MRAIPPMAGLRSEAHLSRVSRDNDEVEAQSRSERDRWTFYETIKESGIMNGTNRGDINPGLRVSIVLKRDQRSGKLTEGIVKDILTKSPTHPHGIKVRLESGEIGRVKKIISGTG